ncbi:hypothetical protein K435DRAFT_863495 [Dendrothele bispora CBS 962.96]|uniref:AB hydrolase-1 domain-containing protein n=1 Tax=Dendrothele bispora (strain CBS 962.96) TaxID=1314807 RepID=A0A4S8LPM3_DENBC|nr:hypothetical protein K435DRAFT_863495 [Dendrothele bispora CBS 962.96]
MIDFANTLFVSPESVPFNIRCAWMGSAMFMSPTMMKLALNRVQSTKELNEAGEIGKLKLLCMNGEKDVQRTSGMAVVEMLKPDVEVIEIKDAGHASFYEKPEETNRGLLQFTKRMVC